MTQTPPEIPAKITALYRMLPPDVKQELAESVGYARTDYLARVLNDPDKMPPFKIRKIAKVINEHYQRSGGKELTIDELLQPIVL